MSFIISVGFLQDGLKGIAQNRAKKKKAGLNLNLP